MWVYGTILDCKLWSELQCSGAISISYKGQHLEYEQNYGLSLQNDIVLPSNIWQDEAVGFGSKHFWYSSKVKKIISALTHCKLFWAIYQTTDAKVSVVKYRLKQ